METSKNDPLFIFFNQSISDVDLPVQFNNPFDYKPHELCVRAASQVQEHLEKSDWEHNFGLIEGKEGTVIGKMFGVLIVKDDQDVGFLTTFSGKMGGRNHYPYFVPPVFDSLEEGNFLSNGMSELIRINQEVERLEDDCVADHQDEINRLKQLRRDNSNALQDGIYDSYRFLNQMGCEKNLRQIFAPTNYNNPPGGAGECAAPKLLQYAFQKDYEPIAMAEFWWGESPSPEGWVHKAFYPACTHKCKPILGHMLAGISVNQDPFS